jgi:23S rRNA pseudouridine2605 synthase
MKPSPKRKKTNQSKPFTKQEPELIRLNKYIANAGICSRREADELIQAGKVKVNGKLVTEMGHKVTRNDKVTFNDKSLQAEKLVYVLLNKPRDFITTVKDPEGRKTVMTLIEKACTERIYPVGRLDRATSGVLLFTNDGELTKKLTHPSHEIRKVYQVTLDKEVRQADMKLLLEGVELEDGIVKADQVSYVKDGTDKREVGIELHSGKNRVIRRTFEHLGYEVMKLDRVLFAGLTKKDLPRGRWRRLTASEVGILKRLSSKKGGK